MTEHRKRGPAAWSGAAKWATASILLAGALVLVVWLVVTDQPLVRYTVRLYQDPYFLRDTVKSWGWAAPLVFMAIQALQVIISPIPGEITGPVGGALFGTWKHILVTGRLRNGVFVADRNSMITKCPSKYIPKKSA